MHQVCSLLSFLLGLALLFSATIASEWQSSSVTRLRRDNTKQLGPKTLPDATNKTRESSASSHSVSHQVPVLKLSAVFAIGNSNNRAQDTRRGSTENSHVEFRSSQTGVGWDDIKGSASSKLSSYRNRNQRKRDDSEDGAGSGDEEDKHEDTQQVSNQHSDVPEDADEQKLAPVAPARKNKHARTKQIKALKTSHAKTEQPSKSRLKLEVSTKTMIKEKVNMNAEKEDSWPNKKHCHHEDSGAKGGDGDPTDSNGYGPDRSFDNHGGSGSSLTDFFEEYDGAKSLDSHRDSGEHSEIPAGDEAEKPKKKHHKKEKKHKQIKKAEQQVQHEHADEHEPAKGEEHDKEEQPKTHEQQAQHQHEQAPVEKKEAKKVTKEAPKVEAVAAVVEKPKEKHHEPKHGHLELHQHQHVEHHHHLNLHPLPVPVAEPEPSPEQHETPIQEHGHELVQEHPEHHYDTGIEDHAIHGHFGNPIHRGFEHHHHPQQPLHHSPIPIKEHWTVPDLIEKAKSKEHPFGAFVIEDHSEMENRESHPGLRYTEEMIGHPHGKGLSPVGVRQLMGEYPAASARSNSKLAKNSSGITPTSSQAKATNEASRN